MKIFSNNKYNEILKYFIIGTVIALLLVLTMFRWDTAKTIFSTVVGIFEPIIWGAVIAFIMNPIAKFTEDGLSKLKFFDKRKKLTKALGVIFSTLVFIAVIALIILSVIPEIISNVPGIYNGIRDELIPGLTRWTNKVLQDYPDVQKIVSEQLSDLSSTVQGILSSLVPKLQGFLTSLFDFANSVKNFVFGVIVAIYFLLSKETLQAQAKRLVVSVFKQEKYERIFEFTNNTNSKLLGFIYGKVIDSVIIGIICFIGMLILRMPYATIVSIIIGITNIIPVFGPFIGAIPTAVLILIAEPKKVIWFLLFIVVLQQLDGNIIGPKILGNRIGLSPFWMLFSIIIFGSMFGIAGMIVGVPLFAVAYDTLNESIKKRLEAKKLPTEESFYQDEEYLEKLAKIEKDPEAGDTNPPAASENMTTKENEDDTKPDP